MNVKELKEKLTGVPEDLPVVVGYGLVDAVNHTWHMPVECVCGDVSAGEAVLVHCELDVAIDDDSCFFLVPELLSDEILRRARKEREQDG